MIGTIQPAWNSFESKESKIDTKNAMCSICQAISTTWGMPFRSLLSYDSIFLSLFSDGNFMSKKRPHFACVKSKKIESKDEEFLAHITIFIGCVKLLDAFADKEIKGTSKIKDKIHKILGTSQLKLESMNVDTASLLEYLQRYELFEQNNQIGTFNELSSPIAKAYGIVFSSIPSAVQSENTVRIDSLREIGEIYGRLTLLLDAVFDADDDKENGNYNIWCNSRDLPKTKALIIEEIVSQYENLTEKSSLLQPSVRNYLLAAKQKSLCRIQSKRKEKKKGRLYSAFIPIAAMCEQDCEGNWHLTDTGAICLAAVFLGVCFCCIHSQGK